MISMPHPSIFRAYDIRGVVGKTLTEDTVFLIGKAIGSVIRENGGTQIAIGRDGRLSGPTLAKALSEGLLSVGCHVVDLGMVPTPVLYYAANLLEGRSGVMLTGSHNPPDYNGLKIVINGITIAEEHITNLYKRILEQRFAEGTGVYRELKICDRYIADILQNVKMARPLKIVVDSGNGVTGRLAPMLFKAMGCEVTELFCEIDGRFPNHHPDPGHPENLQDLVVAVQEHQADIGLAFDGDGDRLGVVTNKGNIIWPDRLLILFAQAVLAQSPQAKIIYDVKCTQYLDQFVRAFGGEPVMWKTGHSLIKAKMAEVGAKLAGEMSGHFFFKDRWNGFDDALYAGARLLEILSHQGHTSDEVFTNIPNSINTSELKILVSDENKFDLMQALVKTVPSDDVQDILTIDGLRVNFKDGWGLVRASNTSPYLILRFEAMNESILEKIQTVFRQWLLSVKSDLVLPF